jgi:hypothetical protein
MCRALTQADVCRLPYGDLVAAICNALTVRPADCRRSLEHQLRVSLSMIHAPQHITTPQALEATDEAAT